MRVKIESPRFSQSVIIPYDRDLRDSLEVAEKWLSENGFDIVSHAEGKNCYYVMSSTFKPLKGE